MSNECAENQTHVKPDFGSTVIFVLSILRLRQPDIRNEAFLSYSFGVDHTVAKQRAKVVCLDLTQEDRQKLVTGWITSGKCLSVQAA